MSYSGRDRNPNRTPQQQWEEFIIELSKRKPQPPKFYEVIKDSRLKSIDTTSIILVFSTQEEVEQANRQWQKIQNELPSNLKRKQIICRLDIPEEAIIESPLQVLKFEELDKDAKDIKLVLKDVKQAEETCEPIYKCLLERIKTLAHETLEVEFPWRLRVGGMRGFQDLLLPALHPVYGVPYIPASSLKGAIKAWAKKNPDKVKVADIDRTLGYLEGDEASIGTVQILDAFPTQPCLSLDIANPQWKWEGEKVKYGAVPHHLLSMEKPKLVIGIALTSRNLKHQDDVQIVKQWLQQALLEGIGSRVSTGYGRLNFDTSLRYQSQHEFQLWTQGMYGFEPPTKANNYKGIPEFRPTAIRGMLRYWFRAIALGIYSPQECKTLEGKLFGTLEGKLSGDVKPRAIEGSYRMGVNWQEIKGNGSTIPDFYKGNIILEAKEQQHLELIEKILQLSSHLAGIGRGARRPLHRNNGRLRGCYWQLSNFQLIANTEVWQQHLSKINNLFQEVQAPQQSPRDGEPGTPKARYQDVLNENAHIYLVPCSGMTHPRSIRDWSLNGSTLAVLGQALELLYSSNRYKGERETSKGVLEGNPWVGGKLEIPSFVVIKSNFPSDKRAYQVVTIFGVNNSDRQLFANELKKLNGAILVYP
ncbi:RAMP superfamily CRISPR-associated protein [Nostoc sp. TCL26-01]|uniref:RAMP superfamily CRISPR-associated protein n=1 Tax=Nostoc sp. TCL26-01 TaxID=2576904 RepID=UPI0015B79F41|nr:RAMP superfamily CRISPR-associated protein [Nostoc sp. TCL26-01]QLE59755.1 CRISPR-associated protein Cmr6 [Nostoc sp. TCL26-01]